MKFPVLILLMSASGISYAQNTFPTTGNVGIGTTSPTNKLDVRGTITMENGTNATIFTGIGNTELNRYLTLINSTDLRSASGLKAGGVLVADTYDFANPAKNDLVVKGNVGIGAKVPSDLLEINHGVERKGITIVGDGDANAYTDILFKINNIAALSSGAVTAWNISHRKDGYFSDNSTPGSSFEFYSLRKGGGYFAPLSFKSNGDVILASNKNATSGNVGIGTTTPKEKLSVNGNIRAREIKVETANWPDYVFEENYEIKSLAEIEAFVNEHKHLPGIPGKKEAEEAGVNLGEMNRKLLEKVEELTLHLIEKDKVINNQQGALNELFQRVKKLEDK